MTQVLPIMSHEAHGSVASRFALPDSTGRLRVFTFLTRYSPGRLNLALINLPVGAIRKTLLPRSASLSTTSTAMRSFNRPSSSRKELWSLLLPCGESRPAPLSCRSHEVLPEALVGVERISGAAEEDRRAGEADLARISEPRPLQHPEEAEEKATVSQGSGPGSKGADRGRSVC